MSCARFVRTEEDDSTDSWEVNLARRYYAKLFKEYAIADMSRYKVRLRTGSPSALAAAATPSPSPVNTWCFGFAYTLFFSLNTFACPPLPFFLLCLNTWFFAAGPTCAYVRQNQAMCAAARHCVLFHCAPRCIITFGGSWRSEQKVLNIADNSN